MNGKENPPWRVEKTHRCGGKRRNAHKLKVEREKKNKKKKQEKFYFDGL